MIAFAARYPIIWHMIEAEGAGCATLYPAATLGGTDANRDSFQRVALAGGRQAILRQQLMTDARLTPSLAGRFAGAPNAWRAHLNQHVFFWVSEGRRDRFLAACVRLRARGVLGPGATPVTLAMETEALLARHGDQAFFSTINTGSTLRGGARAHRDENTLCPVSVWRGERAVELAIRGPVSLHPSLAGARSSQINGTAAAAAQVTM